MVKYVKFYFVYLEVFHSYVFFLFYWAYLHIFGQNLMKNALIYYIIALYKIYVNFHNVKLLNNKNKTLVVSVLCMELSNNWWKTCYMK